MILFAGCAGADCGSVTMTASTSTITRIADFIFGLLSKIKTGADTQRVAAKFTGFRHVPVPARKTEVTPVSGGQKGHDVGSSPQRYTRLNPALRRNCSRKEWAKGAPPMERPAAHTMRAPLRADQFTERRGDPRTGLGDRAGRPADRGTHRRSGRSTGHGGYRHSRAECP